MKLFLTGTRSNNCLFDDLQFDRVVYHCAAAVVRMATKQKRPYLAANWVSKKKKKKKEKKSGELQAGKEERQSRGGGKTLPENNSKTSTKTLYTQRPDP